MKLAIIDANVFDLIQPNKPLHYLQGLSELEIVPARRAREEAEESGKNIPTPLCRDRYAPVHMVTNIPHRRLNDPVVLTGPTLGMVETKKIAATVYAKSTTDSHSADQEILGSAIEKYNSRRLKYEHVYFISADKSFCKKAHKYFAQENICIEVLDARISPAEKIDNIRTVQEVFAPPSH